MTGGETSGSAVRRFNYANVTSTVALFLALAGGTTAVALSGKNAVKKGDIASGAVRAREIAKGAVRTSEIRNGAVSGADLAAGSVGASELLNGSVGTADLAGGPAVRVERRTVTAVADNAFTDVAFEFDSDSPNAYDPAGMFNPSNPEAVTVPVAGLYLITARVIWGPDDTAAPGGDGDAGHRELRLGAGPNLVQPPESRIAASRLNAARTVQEASGVVPIPAHEKVSVHLVQRNEDASAVNAERVMLEVTWIAPMP